MCPDPLRRFHREEYSVKVPESLPVGSVVVAVGARSLSLVTYAITAARSGDGVTWTEDMGPESFLPLAINPTSGAVTLVRELDFEEHREYRVTIRATNVVKASSTCSLVVAVSDSNDNVPRFTSLSFEGVVLENSARGTVVHAARNGTSLGYPLQTSARDLDSGVNGLLYYHIRDRAARQLFSVDSNTGVIQICATSRLDHEAHPEVEFLVFVSDSGAPVRLHAPSPARVHVTILNLNDNPPRFNQSEFQAQVFLPTFEGVRVLQVKATDPDGLSELRFSLMEEGDLEAKNEVSVRPPAFRLNATSGLITVSSPAEVLPEQTLSVMVSDGKFTDRASVKVRALPLPSSGMRFTKKVYQTSAAENSTRRHPIAMVSLIGTALSEHVEFTLLNEEAEGEWFEVERTSGAIQTSGVPLDREQKEWHALVIQAVSPESNPPRVAHVLCNVTVKDMNDNRPIFLDLPYYAMIPHNAPVGYTVAHVRAVDLDKGKNGEIRYELLRSDPELFSISKHSGEIFLDRSPRERYQPEYLLTVAAHDKGTPPLHSETVVRVKLLDQLMPIWDTPYLNATIAEDFPLDIPFLTATAEAPSNSKGESRTR
ncbi:unnamed protein product, partial [Cyprideis torosa]